jgi:predicted metal-dependent phosphoesterase TrpH
VLIDLHCHTLPLSQCSALKPEELIDLARAAGLDGVCLTEHDAYWPAAELAALAGRTGFLVLSGVELTTDGGHILAYGLGDPGVPLATVAALAKAAADAGALLYRAHPARDGLLRLPPDATSTFASVEGINGSDTRLQNASAQALASSFAAPAIGGSDAHSPREAARAATRFWDEIRDTETLVAALRAGRYEAVYL